MPLACFLPMLRRAAALAAAVELTDQLIVPDAVLVGFKES